METGKPIVAVVGAGVMGRGIALATAMGGLHVDLVDQNREIAQSARESLRETLELLSNNGVVPREEQTTILDRIHPWGNLEPVSHSSWVLEAINENLALKQKILAECEKICPPDTILGTNTSTIKLSALSENLRYPDRFLGIHWVNPPYIIPLVEVIVGEKTSPDTVQRTRTFLQELGKVPVLCRDIPGFIINRLQKVMLNEAISILEQGAATVEDIDRAVQYGLGARLALAGPFRINDMTGTKPTSLHGFEYLYRETGQERFQPSRSLQEKVAAGELGIRTLKGWYDYRGQSFPELARRRDETLLKVMRLLATVDPL